MADSENIIINPLKLLRQKDFACIWCSIFFTGLANFTEQFVSIWLVLQLTSDSPWSLFLGGAITFVRLCFAPLSVLSGAIADKVSRKLLVTAMQWIASLLALLMAVLIFLDILELWHLFVIVCLSGLSRIFEMPTAQALASDSVETAHITRAMALVNGGRNLSMLLGLFLAGVLFDSFGPQGTFMVIFFFYGVAGIAPLLMKTKNPLSNNPTESILKSIWGGFKYVKSNQILWAALLVAALINVSGFTFHQTLLPMFAKVVIESSATKASMLMATFAVGAFVGSIVLSSLARNRNQGWTLLLSVIAWHSMMILFSMIQIYIVWMLILLAAGFFWASTLIQIQSLLLGKSDPSYRGRIQGLRTLAIYPHAVAAALSGLMAGIFGVSHVVMFNGALGILFMLAVIVLAPKLRKI